MTTDEILQQLTPAQRTELQGNLQIIAANASGDYKKKPEQFAQLSAPVHLKGNIYLNVTISLHQGDKDIVHPVIENIDQFESADAYLNATHKTQV
ncbi:MAG: hypothetical protein ABIR15_16390 [Chitinophagaceae bacterium]